jgi:hypothetical protein
MHPAIHHQIAQARIADPHHRARRSALALAARPLISLHRRSS